jgi:hypothetical protein
MRSGYWANSEGSGTKMEVTGQGGNKESLNGDSEAESLFD